MRFPNTALTADSHCMAGWSATNVRGMASRSRPFIA
jgi:hypothetical protein